MRTIIRTLSFFEQWTAEVLRQPALIFTLVVAPFLLLFAFGQGVDIGGPRPETLIVQEPDAEVQIEPLLEDLEQAVVIVGVTESLPLARQALERGDVDAIAIMPSDPNTRIQNNEYVPIHVILNEVDPVRHSYARSFLQEQVSALNRRAVAEALARAQEGADTDSGALQDTTSQARGDVRALRDASNRSESRSAISRLRSTLEPLSSGEAGVGGLAVLALPGLAAGGDSVPETVAGIYSQLDDIERRLDDDGSNARPRETEILGLEASLAALEGAAAGGNPANLDPHLLSAPFYLELEDIAPSAPTFTIFYSPGVVALLVQHLAITLAALTLARMRLLNLTDVLRVAPIRTSEIVLGNYLSYAVLCGLAATGLLAMLVLVLGISVVGSLAMVALIVTLLIFSSLGYGFLASQLSSSVQQAAQIAMLLLLASIFFGGFAFSLDRISWPERAISHALPATYGISALQDVMLRGFSPDPLDIAFLAGSGAVLLLLNIFILRRAMRASQGTRRREDETTAETHPEAPPL